MAEFPSRPPLEVWDSKNMTSDAMHVQGESQLHRATLLWARHGGSVIFGEFSARLAPKERKVQAQHRIVLRRWRHPNALRALALEKARAGPRPFFGGSSTTFCFDVLDEPEIAPLGTDLLCISDGEDPQIDPPTEKCLFAIAIAASRNNT
ncbi:hypothetical protein SCUP515_02754 [Seiridium cupressi]